MALGDIDKKKTKNLDPLSGGAMALDSFGKLIQNDTNKLLEKSMVTGDAGNQVFSPSKMVYEAFKRTGETLGLDDQSTEGFNTSTVKSPEAIAEINSLGGFNATTAGGTPEQKMQGGQGGFSLPNTDFTGYGAKAKLEDTQSTVPAEPVDITKTPGINPQGAAGLGVSGNTMTYRSPEGGLATITGPGVGSRNWDNERITQGVSTIGDWAGEEAKAVSHQAGLARLRAGLPYDAKEAAQVKAQGQAARAARDQAWLADYDARSRQDKLLGDINSAAQNLENQASWNMRGSNPKRKLAESLYDNAAALRAGAGNQAIAGNADVVQAEVTGRAALGASENAANARQGTAGMLTPKDLLDQQYKQQQLRNEDRRFALDQDRFGLDVETKSAEIGQRQQKEEADRLQKTRENVLGVDKETAKAFGDPAVDRMTARRAAQLSYQGAGLNPLEAQVKTMMQDPDALKNLSLMDEAGRLPQNALDNLVGLGAYSPQAVDAVMKLIQKRRLGQ